MPSVAQMLFEVTMPLEERALLDQKMPLDEKLAWEKKKAFALKFCRPWFSLEPKKCSLE